MAGWMTLLITIFVGSVFVDLMDVALPAPIQDLVPWSPSVALVHVKRYAYLHGVVWDEVWVSLGRLAVYSGLLYALVVYKVRRVNR
jgi:ABC-type multidrug transport system permease subunit